MNHRARLLAEIEESILDFRAKNNLLEETEYRIVRYFIRNSESTKTIGVRDLASKIRKSYGGVSTKIEKLSKRNLINTARISINKVYISAGSELRRLAEEYGKILKNY